MEIHADNIFQNEDQLRAFVGSPADLAVAKLDPITSEMNKLIDDPAHIDQILKEGKSSAISVAEPVLQKTKEIIGFLS